MFIEVINIANNVVLGSAFTNENGVYNIIVDDTSGAPYNIKTEIVLKGNRFKVGTISNYLDSNTYRVLCDTRNNVYSGSIVINVPYTFSKDSTIGKAASVHQAIVMAYDYIYDLSSYYLCDLKIVYPVTGDVSYYDKISGLHTLFISSYHATSWDTIHHEFGHFIEKYYNLYGEYSPPYSHIIQGDLSSYGGPAYGKDKAIKLAWVEGWATYFAIHMQMSVDASNQSIPYVGDNIYDDTYLDLHADLENYTIISHGTTLSGYFGETNEHTVSCILYDYTDNQVSLSDFDEILMADYLFWNIITNDHCQTLSDFASSFYSSTNISSWGKISSGTTFQHYDLGVHNITYINLNTDNPRFDWIVPNANLNYKYRVSFYNSSYSLIYSYPYYHNYNYQNLAKSIWNSIKNATGTYFYIVVESIEKTSPQTGPYWSYLKVYKP